MATLQRLYETANDERQAAMTALSQATTTHNETIETWKQKVASLTRELESITQVCIPLSSLAII